MDKELDELKQILGPKQGHRFIEKEKPCLWCGVNTNEPFGDTLGAFCSKQCLQKYANKYKVPID